MALVLAVASPGLATVRGAQDWTFGGAPTGLVRTDFGAHEHPTRVERGPDGTALVSGLRSPESHGWPTHVALARHLTTGSLDPGFGRDGTVLVPTDGWPHVAATPDGGALVVDSGPGGDGFRVRRVLADGRIDDAFGTDGSVLRSASEASAVAVDGDGGFVVVAQSGAAVAYTSAAVEQALHRFDHDGRPDPQFGLDGVAPYSPVVAPGTGMLIQAVDVAPSGRIVLAGSVLRGTEWDDVFVSRVLADGSADDDFGTDGTRVVDAGDREWFVVLELDDEAVLVGVATFEDSPPYGGWGVVRLTSRGTLDEGFGSRGIALVASGGDDSYHLGDLSVGTAGRVYASLSVGSWRHPTPTTTPCWEACPRGAITALDGTGSIDDGFGDDGTAWLPTADAVTVAAGPHLLVAGTLTGGTGLDFGLLRLFESDGGPVRRLGGADRTETSVQISMERFEPREPRTAYLARDDVFTDAAVAGVLRDGPILVVPRCGEAPDVVKEELRRLKVPSVTALGGPEAICDQMLASAAESRYQDRISGSDRFATSAAVALAAFDTAPRVYLARADDVVDAVAGGTLTDGPVVLVPRCGTVPGVVEEAIASLDPQEVVALGGASAICDATLASAADGRPSSRLAGSDRYGTAIAIAHHVFPRGDAARVYLARADLVVDALAGGTLIDGPVLIVDACGDLDAPHLRPVADEIGRHGPEEVVALGGPSAVCDRTLAQAGERR